MKGAGIAGRIEWGDHALKIQTVSTVAHRRRPVAAFSEPIQHPPQHGRVTSPDGKRPAVWPGGMAAAFWDAVSVAGPNELLRELRMQRPVRAVTAKFTKARIEFAAIKVKACCAESGLTLSAVLPRCCPARHATARAADNAEESPTISDC